eukprot:g3943.t1
MLTEGELQGLELQTEEYIALLGKLIGESRHVQNNPRQGLIPQEGKVLAHIKEVLNPYSSENGGPLLLQEYEYTSGRPNFKITYPGETDKTVGFIGSHLDVVPADPSEWECDPFKLTVEGNKLYGRGTTDCLGHVGMITLLMKALAEKKPKLKRSIVVLFICGEEGGEAGVGIDMVVENKGIEELKNGVIFWVDCADSQPCCGTAGSLTWSLKSTGRRFHSGLPHLAVNSLELGSEALAIIQRRFYHDHPAHPEEAAYGFSTSSTMKPTHVESAKGALNQIPPWTTFSGDIRLTPFYDVIEVMRKVEKYVEDLNENLWSIPTRGPSSKYTLEGDDIDVKRGKLELTWGSSEEEALQMEGIACNLSSPGLKAMTDSIREVKGASKQYSITGSLPLVRSLQRNGFDVQLVGFGLSSTYHATNEYALLSDMSDAFQVLLRVITKMDVEI